MEKFNFNYFESEELRKEEKYWLRCVNLDKELKIVNSRVEAQSEFIKAQNQKINDLLNQIKLKDKEIFNVQEKRMKMNKSDRRDKIVKDLLKDVDKINGKNRGLKIEVERLKREIDGLIFKLNNNE